MAEEKTYAPGYAEYAAYLSLEPELANFPRFNEYSLRNLIHLMEQVRVVGMQLKDMDEEEERFLHDSTKTQWDKMCKCTESSGCDKTHVKFANNCWTSFARASEDCERSRKKMETVRKLEDVTKRYQEALLSHQAMMRLPTAQPHVLQVLRKWITDNIALIDNTEMRNEGCSEDVVSLYHAPYEEDLLSRGVRALTSYFYKREKCLPSGGGSIPVYDAGTTQRITAFVSVMMAVIMLFGATAVLTFAVSLSPAQRMSMIGVFTTIFATLIGGLTNSKRGELFVAVSTYSAVLVVFAEVTNKQ